LIPLELEKLKTKIKSEIRAAEVRIGYLLKKSTSALNQLNSQKSKKDIKNLSAKYTDDSVHIFTAKKRTIEPRKTSQRQKSSTALKNLSNQR
jgi:hypothetical protein